MDLLFRGSFGRFFVSSVRLRKERLWRFVFLKKAVTSQGLASTCSAAKAVVNVCVFSGGTVHR